jgi:hypothetical protein
MAYDRAYSAREKSRESPATARKPLGGLAGAEQLVSIG